ncbi:carotenoid cleavage dioxygenase 7, chloroplastic [Typha latifolia]|uniref:carotenoid cleavage dioxygenase 7, chloroplastic n=1 Tax=Typha latifolia TaxID=4733 RepID=UPI003C2B66F4
MHSLPHNHLIPLPPPPPETNLPLSSSSAAVGSHHRIIPSAASTVVTSPTPSSSSSAASGGDSPAAAFWDYNLLFASQRSESPDPIPLRLAAGSIPADFPAGTYYLAGPGLFSDDHGSTVHPLDGHGYLRAFDFDSSGAVRYSARYVATAAEREERNGDGGKMWRFTHRGPFSVLKGGKRVGNVKVMKNVANTSVVRWGGRLLCLWEGGDPYEIDPRSLDTVGPVDLVGFKDGNPDIDRAAAAAEEDGNGWRWTARLKDMGVNVAAHCLKPILGGVFNMPPKRLLSHYKIDPKRNRLLMLSCNAEDMLLPRSNFTFYEFDYNFELIEKKEFIIPDHLMIHDWAFTDGHYVLLGNRIKLDVPGSLLALSGLYPMISALSVNPSQQSTPIYLLPRHAESSNGAGRDWRVPVEAPSQMWALHIGNAFEESDVNGNLEIQMQVSVCSYQWFNFHRMFGYNWRNGKLDPSFMNAAKGKEAFLPHLVKISINMDARKGTSGRCKVASLSSQWNKPADFPAISPAFSGRRNAYIYAGAASGSRRFLPHFPFDSVIKLNTLDGSVASWSTGSRIFVGEPIFIPRDGEKEEDDGYILVVEYAVSKQRCYLVILDARRIGGGTNAVVAKLEVPKRLTFPLGFHGFWACR